MSSEPYAPPRGEEAGGAALTAVVGAWALAGAALGTASGATLQLIGVIPGVVPLGLGGAVAGGVAGMVAWGMERRLSRERPALVDGHGRTVRPVAAWLYAVPVVLLAGSLLVLVVIGSVRADSIVPGVLFLGVALAIASLLRPLLVNQRLARAVEAMTAGRTDEAERRFRSLLERRGTTRTGVAQARLHLGLLALQRGDLEEAARWYAMPARGRVAAFAGTGLALVRVLQDRFDEAEVALRRAVAAGAGRAIQSEVDAVRLLLVLRTEGPEEARAMGERLHGPESGDLLTGILAVARRRSGDASGAARLLDPGTRQRLAASGLASAIPEVREAVDA